MKKPPQVVEPTPEVAVRLYWLERLIDDEYEGKASIFQDRTGIKMSQVNQWFSGYRALRENALRRIEEATGKDRGWFDRPAGAAFEASAITPTSGSATLTVAHRPSESDPDELGVTLTIVARAMAKVDKIDRSSLIHLFSLLGEDEAENVHIAHRMANLLSGSAPAENRLQDGQKKGSGWDITHRLRGDNNEQRDSTEEQERRRGLRGLPGGGAGES